MIEEIEGVLTPKLKEKFPVIETSFSALKDAYTDYKAGLDKIGKDEPLKIGIVGMMKAGKSTFLNVLLFDGEDILPTDATPTTAVITRLTYSENQKVEIEYYNANEWQQLQTLHDDAKEDMQQKKLNDPDYLRLDENGKREYDKRLLDQLPDKFKTAYQIVEDAIKKGITEYYVGHAAEPKNFQEPNEIAGLLRPYVSADGEYISVVKRVNIYVNVPGLYYEKDGEKVAFEIVDTPGMNDPVETREAQTRAFLKEAHGVIFLTAAAASLSEADVNFANQEISGNGIGAMALVASKFDNLVMSDNDTECFDDAINHCRRIINDAISERGANIKASYYAYIISSLAEMTLIINAKTGTPLRQLLEQDELMSRMVRDFPDAFNDEECCRCSLKELSGFDELRDCIKNNFIGKKDETIRKAQEEYITQHRRRVVAALDAFITSINNYKTVCTTPIENFMRTKRVLTAARERMSRTIQSIILLCANNLETSLNLSLNNVVAGKLEYNMESVEIKSESTFLRNTRSETVYVPDIFQIRHINGPAHKALSEFNSKVHEILVGASEQLKQNLYDELPPQTREFEEMYDVLRTVFSIVFESDVLRYDLPSFDTQVSDGFESIKNIPFEYTYTRYLDRMRRNEFELEVAKLKNSIKEASTFYNNSVAECIQAVLKSIKQSAIAWCKTKCRQLLATSENLINSINREIDNIIEEQRNLAGVDTVLRELNKALTTVVDQKQAFEAANNANQA